MFSMAYQVLFSFIVCNKLCTFIMYYCINFALMFPVLICILFLFNIGTFHICLDSQREVSLSQQMFRHLWCCSMGWQRQRPRVPLQIPGGHLIDKLLLLKMFCAEMCDSKTKRHYTSCVFQWRISKMKLLTVV